MVTLRPVEDSDILKITQYELLNQACILINIGTLHVFIFTYFILDVQVLCGSVYKKNLTAHISVVLTSRHGLTSLKLVVIVFCADCISVFLNRHVSLLNNLSHSFHC